MGERQKHLAQSTLPLGASLPSLPLARSPSQPEAWFSSGTGQPASQTVDRELSAGPCWAQRREIKFN